MHLIGICGKKGAGKDLFSSYLNEDLKWNTIAFAKPIKEAAKTIFLLKDSQVNGTLEEKETFDVRWEKTPRQLLQELGTEVGRAMDPELWVKRCFLEIDQRPGDSGWIITDVRFINEAEALKAKGGVLIKIIREHSGTGVCESHISEQQISGIVPDITIYNSGTKEDLKKRAREVSKLFKI